MTESRDPLDLHLGLASDGPEAAVLRLLIELCAQVVGASEGSLLVVDDSEDPPRNLRFAMTVGSPTSESALVGQRVPLGQGLTGLAAVTREVQIGAPLYDGVQQARRAEATPGEIQSVIAAPMLAGDDLVGVITAVSFEPGKRFSGADASLYARAASVAGVLVDQRRQLERLGDRPGTGPVLAAAHRLLDLDDGARDEVVRLLDAVLALARSRAR